MGKATNPKPRGKKAPAAPRALVSTIERQPAEDTSVLRARRAEKARLKAQGAQVFTNKQTEEITGAKRPDVFSTMAAARERPEVKGQLGKPALSGVAFQAFRDHEASVHVAMGADTADRRPDYIRASVVGAPGQNVSEQMVDAAELVRSTLSRLSPPDALLLNMLMVPGNALVPTWRTVVQQITGEKRPEAQAARIRSLGENLHHARRAATQALAPLNEARRAIRNADAA